MPVLPSTTTLATPDRFPLGAHSLALGATETGAAVVTELEHKTTRQGKPFARLTLRNATGAATVNVWAESIPALTDISSGTPVRVTLTLVTGRDGAEWQFADIQRLPANHAVAREALPQGRVSRASLTARTTRLLKAMSPEARELLLLAMETPVTTGGGTAFTLKERFYVAPAAVGHHHAHIQGLWHHTVQVAEGALSLARCYLEAGDIKSLDLDVVLAASLLHDCGKVITYSWTGTIGMAPLDAAMSHMGWGLRILDEALLRAELAGGWTPSARQRNLAEAIAHGIAAHHGRLEWGALAVPASLEIQLVHLADVASSTLQPLTDAVASLPEHASGWHQIQDGWRKRFIFASPTVTEADAAPTTPYDPPASDALLTFTLDAIAQEA